MKKIIFLLLAAVAFLIKATAQNLPLPTGKPQLPAPVLKPVQPADLVITNISLTEAVFSNDLKNWVIKVSVTVKNAGGLMSIATDLKAFAKQTSNNTWKPTGTMGILIGLRPGESVTKEYVFVDKQKLLPARAGFEFKVQADSNNKVTESNENNNVSAILAVPAAQ